MNRKASILSLLSLFLLSGCTVVDIADNNQNADVDDKEKDPSENPDDKKDDQGGKDTDPDDGKKEEPSEPTEPTEMTGRGSYSNPYKISNKAQLLDFQAKIKEKSTYREKYYSLTADIDCTGLEWTGIGTFSAPFKGEFDGNGYTLKGLKFSSTVVDGTRQSAGFFGVCSFATIQGLHLTDVTYSLTVAGTDTNAFLGGILGYGVNTYVSYCSVDYSSYNVTSNQQGTSSLLISGGLVGFVQMSFDDDGNTYFVDTLASSVTGNLNVDVSKAEIAYSVTAGIVGYAYTNGYGIYCVNSCYFHGSLKGGKYVSGIIGYMSYYASVIDCYAYGKSIAANDTSGAYAAGIIGYSAFETAVLNTYSEFETITATKSTDSKNPSYVGSTGAILAEDAYTEYEDAQGVGLYQNYTKKGVTLSGDTLVSQDTEIDAVNADFFKNTMGFTSDYWTFDSIYPTLYKDSQGDIGEKTITLDGTSKTYRTQASGYDYDMINSIMSVGLTKEGYSFYGFTYDKEGNVTYRWYAPFNRDTTLYPGFASVTDLLGNYDISYTENGKTLSKGKWKLDEDYFYWLQEDGSYDKYYYTYNGIYLLLGSYVAPSSTVDSDGSNYEYSIFHVNDDGTIDTLDYNNSTITYTGTKSQSSLSLPDYTGKKFLGSWKGYYDSFDLYKEGQAVMNYGTSSVSGGFVINDEKITIISTDKSIENLIYDETNDILYSGACFYSRNTVTGFYKTKDVDLLIAVSGSTTYVVKDGKLGDSTKLSGTLTDGSTISYDGTSYTISGNELTKQENSNNASYLNLFN